MFLKCCWLATIVLVATLGVGCSESKPPTAPSGLPVPSATVSQPDELGVTASSTGASRAQALPTLPSMEHPIRGMQMAYDGCSTAAPELWKYSVVWTGNYSAGRVCEGRGTHSGVDIPLPARTPVYSVADGEIVAVNRYGRRGAAPAAGVYVITKHEVIRAVIGGPAPPQLIVYAAYFHLTEGTVPSHFSNGVRVRKGEYIGGSGNTGDTRGATGQHLHFQIEGDYGGQHPYYHSSQTHNPIRFIQQHMWDWVR